MSSTVENTQTPVSIIMDQVKAFSFTDLLTLQASIATLIKVEYKKVAKASKVKHVKDPNAPKKELSVGMLAWKAYVKDLVAKQPELFTGAKPTEKQQIASKYKQEHMEDYKKFAAEFAEAHVPVVSTNNNAEVPEVKAEVIPEAAVIPEVQTTVIMEAKPKKVKAAKTESSESGDKPKKVKAESDSADKPKKVKAESADKPKKSKAKAEESNAKAESNVADDAPYKKITVDGTTYWHIVKTDEVYACDEQDGFGEEVGTYNPASNTITFA
jgi:hypothetical protein